MHPSISGIHHITAIASDPQRNLDLYTHVLGLRLVKLTVNYDAPETYHFYLADADGHPGTILTFFPWPNARTGIHGKGQAGSLAFSIPPGSMDYWMDRLDRHDVLVTGSFQRFDERGIAFHDPDGLLVELVEAQMDAAPGVSAWHGSLVPAEMALRGFHSVTLWEADIAATAELLQGIFGFQHLGTTAGRTRLSARSGQPGRIVDLLHQAGIPTGRMGTGIVHHVAWRAKDDTDQLAWRKELVEGGYDVTQVIDRQYFHSIYFREPGGVLFEIATDPPGFIVDEEPDCLGTSLKLPSWLEPRRADITRQLPVLRLPAACPEPA